MRPAEQTSAAASPQFLDAIAAEVARVHATAPRRPWRGDRVAGLADHDLVLAAERLLAVLTAPESEIGHMPPVPPTLRGKIGAVVIRLLRRCFFWQSAQMNSAVSSVCQLLRNQAERIVELESELGQVRAELQRFRPEPDTGSFDQIYAAFQSDFRGSREEIRLRLEEFVPRLLANGLGASNMPVLDLGCGRGEWLEVLQERGLSGVGVDANQQCVTECRSRGLVVHHSDALRFLRRLPAESQGAITAFHVVEHLAFSHICQLLDECARVLRRGGMLIAETPNPANLIVGSCTFHLDPTHVRPLPADLMRFVMESRGFSKVEIVPLHPFEETMRLPPAGDEAAAINKWLFGPRDYAVIACKS